MRRNYLGVLIVALSLVVLISACGGGDSKPVVNDPTQAPATVSQPGTTVPTVVPTTVPTSTPASATIPKEKQDAWVKKINQAVDHLAPLAKPGGFTNALNRAKSNSPSWDIKQIELDGRLRLEAFLGKDATLQNRGQPGSNPPPDEGYLKALIAAIQSGQLRNVGGSSAADPLRVKGVERLITDIVNGLAVFNLSGVGEYEKERPTAATKSKFGPNQALGADGIINIPGVKDAYFLMVEIYYEVQPLIQGAVRAP